MMFHRTFNIPWPAVLAELTDFVNQARLATAGQYQTLEVSVKLSKALPPEYLLTPEFLAFRSGLENLPACRVRFAAVDEPYHSIDIDIQR